MEVKSCLTCNKPKASLECGICHETVCKSCAQIIPEDSFSFLKTTPEVLQHRLFCAPCYDLHIAEPLADYEATMAKAKDTIVFFKKQGKETRLVKRFEEPVQVTDCADHDEAILRLAFYAAKMGYNAIIDVDVAHVKVGQQSYKKMIYNATGVPANVFADKLVKDRSSWSNPN